MTTTKGSDRPRKDTDNRSRGTFERYGGTSRTKRRRNDEGGHKDENDDTDENSYALGHRRRRKEHSGHEKVKRHRSSRDEKQSHHHYNDHKYDTSSRRPERTSDDHRHNSSRDAARKQRPHNVKSALETRPKTASSTIVGNKSLAVTESSLSLSLSLSSPSSSSSSSLSSSSPTVAPTPNTTNQDPPPQIPSPPSPSPPPPPPPPLPPSSSPPPPPPSSSSVAATATGTHTTTIPSSYNLTGEADPSAAAPIVDTYYPYSLIDQTTHQQHSSSLSSSQEQWHYYNDPTNTTWTYDAQQQYDQYQVASATDPVPYYSQHPSAVTDPSMYYAQHYYTEQHDTTSSYYASFQQQPPPPPPPLPITYHDPTQSYSGIEELSYPYPTFEDPATLFEKIGQVGEGTYGKVYKARNCKTGQLWALKRIRMKTEKEGFPITAIREIKLLQKLKHERIVLLQEILVSKGSVYMVLEYMDHDLSGILGHPDFRFEPAHAKSLTKQILQGLGYLHRMGILHRDMKGSNLLVNNKGELKIADFGLARIFQKNQPGDYTNRVITLWYRPPELLLGATAYDTAVDVWGVGCIMLEFFVGKPIFNGTDEISQLDSIYKLMGTPTKETWPAVEELPWYTLVRPKQNHENVFRETYKSLLTPGALALSEALLSMDPLNRPTAAEALEFDYFKTEEPKDRLPANLLDMNDDWHDFESKQRKRKLAAI